MTDRVAFLYLRKEFTETLSEKWAMNLTQREESQASSSSGQPTAPCAGSTPATPDSCKDEPQAICGGVERSKQFEISDSFGVVFTAQLFVCVFVYFFRLPKHFSWAKVLSSLFFVQAN